MVDDKADEKLVVIYRARSGHEADILKVLLGHADIEAFVQNSFLDSPFRVDLIGFPTTPRVLVADSDAEEARGLAMEFDAELVAAARRSTDDETEEGPDVTPTTVDEWPICPECSTPRPARCPICGTTGSEFSAVDMGFSWVPGEQPAEAGADCSCGSHGCGRHGGGREQGPPVTPVADQDEDADPWDSGMLMCHGCDEPFRPDYRRECEGCGHRFADGFETTAGAPPLELAGSRIVVVFLAFAVLAAVVAAYFTFLF